MKRLLCMILCLCMVCSLFTTPISALDYINKITVTVDAPAEGFHPGKATTSATASSEVTNTEWLDGSGKVMSAADTFKAGQKYTVKVTLGMKDTVDKPFNRTDDKLLTINGKQAKVESFGFSKVVLSYTFTSVAAGRDVSVLKVSSVEPVAGGKPADVVITDGPGLQITRTEWLDGSGKVMSANAAFKAGEKYTVRYTATTSAATTKLKLTEGENLILSVGKVNYPAELVSCTESSAVVQLRFASASAKTAAVAKDGVISTAHFHLIPPAPGDKPSPHVSVDESDALIVTQILWNTSGKLDANGGFLAQKMYDIQFGVVSKDASIVLGPDENGETHFYINGEEYMGYTTDGGRSYIFTTYLTATLPADVVDLNEIYTLEQANALNPDLHPTEAIFNEKTKAQFSARSVTDVYDLMYSGQFEDQCITRLLLDFPSETDLGVSFLAHYSLKELWLSPEMDVAEILKNYEMSPFNHRYYNGDQGGATWNFKLYISGDKYPQGLLSLDEVTKSSLSERSLRFEVVLYYGDVYEAFRNPTGCKGADDWCPGHKFTACVQTADRVLKYMTCQHARYYYYSCKHCGKPENDPNHTFIGGDGPSPTFGSDLMDSADHLWVNIIDDAHLIGTNAEGDPVYVQTCKVCGLDQRDVIRGVGYTKEMLYRDFGKNTERTYDEYIKAQQDQWDNYTKYWELETTVEEPGLRSFAIEAEKVVTANVRASYRNEINWAAQNDLVDFELLGNDYTKDMTRLQFCSVAVRMAEKMAGKSITPAPADTFTDCTNEYALKAYAAGITTGQTATTFNPDGTLTRQQMAAFIYRALMWVRDNSAIRYTPYESKLATHTDADKLSSYAVAPMAFMNALGLINGNKEGALNPKNNCTIQQALAVAYRSLSADEIGWYQCCKTSYHDAYCYGLHGDLITQNTYHLGERVWVSSAAYEGFYAIPDTYTGDTLWAPVDSFRPIKELKEGDAERYQQYFPQ